MNEFEKRMLDELAASLPLHPPLQPGGDVTVSEMCPDLTREELDYVMSRYKGTMMRSADSATQ